MGEIGVGELKVTGADREVSRIFDRECVIGIFN